MTFKTSFSKPQKYGLAMKNVNKVPIDFFTVSSEVRDYALTLLPKSLTEIEIPEVIILSLTANEIINPAMMAHIDYKRFCALNVYLQTNDETTHFYEWNNENKTLKDIGKFQAKTGDWWLLNTSIPHSAMLTPGKRRIILSFSFSKMKYDEVERILMTAI